MTDTLSASEMPSERPVSAARAAAAAAARAAANPQVVQPALSVPSSTGGGLSKLLHEQCSASKSPRNELTNCLKRPLLDKAVKNDEIKKIRLTESNHSEKQLDITILSSTNHNKKDIVNIVSKENDHIPCSIKTIGGNVFEVSANIASENHRKDGENDTILDSVSDDNYCKLNVKSTSRKIVCEESDKKKLNNTSNILDKCAPVLSQFSETIINRKNDIVENGNSSLCHRLSPDDLIIVENSKDNSDHRYSSTLAEIGDKNKTNLNHFGCALSEIPEVLHSVSKDNSKMNIEPLEPQNTAVITEIESKTCDSNGHTMDGVSDHSIDVMEVTDSDSENNIADNDDLIDDKVLEEITNGISKLSECNFVNLMRIFKKKNISFQHFESFVLQKCVEFLTDGSDQGRKRSEVDAFLEKEKEWKFRFKYLNARVSELKAIIKVHKEDLQKNPVARPHVITRTVGLQAVLCQKKEIGFAPRLPKTIILPAIQQSNNNSVSVISDDEDDDIVEEVQLNTTDIQNSCDKTTENASPIMPSMPSPTPSVTLLKEVHSILNVPVDNSAACIDLTNDIVDEPMTNNKDPSSKSPVKIAPRPSTSVSQGSPSSCQTKNSSIQHAVTTKNVAFISSNIATSTSNLLVRTSAPSSERAITSNLNPGTTMMVTASRRHPSGFVPINANVVRDGQRFTIVGPVLNRQMQQVNVTYARQMQAAPLCLAPVPPSIPIHKHPAPLPKIPNQRNVPTWRKLPPAPILTASITDGSHNALLLSWNLAVNKGFADITNYQIYAYHETSALAKSDLWKQIGEVSALPLPMACSLTQFSAGQKYHFAVRAVDAHSRVGPFSLPQSVVLNN